MAGDLDRYRTRSQRIRTLLRRDKERYVRGFAIDVKGCLHANGSRTALQTLKKLCSKSTSQKSTVYSVSYGQIVFHLGGCWACSAVLGAAEHDRASSWSAEGCC